MTNIPYEGYVDAHVAVYGGTVKADVYAKGDARPGWVSRLTVNTHLDVNKKRRLASWLERRESVGLGRVDRVRRWKWKWKGN